MCVVLPVGLWGAMASRAGERNRPRNALRAHKIHPLSSTRTAPRTTPLIAFRHLHRSPPPLTASTRGRRNIVRRRRRSAPPATPDDLPSPPSPLPPSWPPLASAVALEGASLSRRVPSPLAAKTPARPGLYRSRLSASFDARRSQLRSRGRIVERRAALLSGAARHCATLIQPHISLLRPRTDARSPTSPLRSLSPIDARLAPRFPAHPI